MKYIKLDRYIVCLEYVHGVLHNFPTGVVNAAMPKRYQIDITYNGGMMVMLEFPTKEESQLSFDKIADALGSG